MAKKEWPPKGGEDPKDKEKKKGFAVSAKTRKEDRERLARRRDDPRHNEAVGDGTFTGAPAPRSGGKQKPIAKSGPVSGGTKKQLRQSKRRVNKSAASPAAKRSARKLYR